MKSDVRIRTLIVDDEPIARETIRGLLRRHPPFEVVGDGENASDALRQIRDLAPDLVFLDIRMPGMDAFRMLAQLDPATIPIVVFVTAYERYALQAFEVQALDYLLKPFDDERFDKVASHVLQYFSNWEVHPMTQRLLAAIQGQKLGEPNAYAKELVLPGMGKTVLLLVEDLDWIGADDYYARAHMGDKTYLIRESLTKLAAKLDPRKFARIHRSAIVNLQKIKEVHRSSVLLRSGIWISTSRVGRRELKAALAERK